MKLRFRKNSMRLRVNRPEVENLAAGGALEERVEFPDGAVFRYSLESCAGPTPGVSFRDGVIRIAAPEWQMKDWARGEAVGLYFQVGGTGTDRTLHVSIEKDLECLDPPPEERDADAFPRTSGKNC